MTISRFSGAVAIALFISPLAAAQQERPPSRYERAYEAAPEPRATERAAPVTQTPAARTAQAARAVTPANAAALQPAAPFQLSPDEARFVDELLAAWERHSAEIKTFECEFTLWEYRPNDPALIGVNGHPKAAIISSGELKFRKPDRGLFHVTETQVYNPATGKFQKADEIMNQHWVCDGTTVWEIDHAQKQVKENPIPPEMQGKHIGDGPLPFMLFGGEAAKLKARYFLRERTDPQFAAKEIWLEAYPRWRNDAANFKSAQIIMKRSDFLPYALRLYSPEGSDYKVFEFRSIRLSNPFFPDSKLKQPKTPSGYQLVRARG